MRLRSVTIGAIIPAALIGSAALAGPTAPSGTFILQQKIDRSILTPFKISTNGGKPLTNGGTSYEQVYAGQERVAHTGGTSQIDTPAEFYTFCIETAQQLASTTYNVGLLQNGDKSGINAATGLGVQRADEISQLILKNTVSLYTPLTAVQGAALQLAIWEVADEPAGATLDLTTGDFRVLPVLNNKTERTNDPLILALAQQELNAITYPGPTTQNLFALISTRYQDLLIENGQPNIIGAPEPAALSLFGIGALATAIVRRRRA